MPFNPVGYYPRQPLHHQQQRLVDNSIDDQGPISHAQRGATFALLSLGDALTTIRNQERDRIASFWFAADNTLFSTHHVRYFYELHLDGYSVKSNFPQEVVDAMGYIDFGESLMPSMALRMRTSLESNWEVYTWDKNIISEEAFGEFPDHAKALVIRNLQRGETELELKSQNPTQILRGNRLFLGKHRVEDVNGRSNYLLVPHLILASRQDSWTPQATEVLKEIMRTLYSYDYSTIKEQWNKFGFELNPNLSMLGQQGFATIYGVVPRDPATRVQPPQPAMQADSFATLEKLDNAFFTPTGNKVLEIRKREQAAAFDRNAAALNANALAEQVERETRNVESLMEQLNQARIKLATTRSSLADAQLKLPEAIQTQARLTQIHHSLMQASEGLSEQLIHALKDVEATGEKLIEYFTNWGVTISELVLLNKQTCSFVEAKEISLEDLLGKNYQIARLMFRTLEPKPLEVVDRTGNKLDDNRICGPFECLVTYSPGEGLTFKYRAWDTNGPIGVNWANFNEDELICKIHPHHYYERIENGESIVGRWIEGACLGEVAPSLLDAVQNNKVRLAVTGCLTFIHAALGVDDWGRHYKWFPYECNFKVGLTAEEQRQLIDNSSALERWQNKPNTLDRRMRFVVDNSQKLMLMQVSPRPDHFSNKLFSRWIPMGDRTPKEVIASVLSEFEIPFEEANWLKISQRTLEDNSNEEAEQ